jgi:hypothetical protein
MTLTKPPNPVTPNRTDEGFDFVRLYHCKWLNRTYNPPEVNCDKENPGDF